MKLKNIIKFRDWLFDFTAKMTNDHILGEQEVLYMVKDKFSSLGLNDNKIDKEPIDEDKLDELAENWNINYAIHPHMEDYEDYNRNDVVEAFKYGYRKAKEE